MKILFLVIIVLVLLLLTAGYAMFFIGIVRFPREAPVTVPKKHQRFAEQINGGMDWFKAQSPERVVITSHDGLRLVGHYLHHPGTRGTVLLMHGFRSDAYYDFSCAFRTYYDLGFSVLSVYQRAHGESEGRYISYGVKERFDCRDWALYIADRFGPDHDIFLDGLSMGSSTVLMATGLELPGSVRGVIADCGFTCPYDEFAHVLKTRFHLPVHPFIDIAEGFSHIFAGFGFRDYSTLTALESNTLPVLFVHGEDDSFVPLKFTIANYAACTAEKKLVTVPGAEHGLSFLIDTETCRRALEEFLNKYSTVK